MYKNIKNLCLLFNFRLKLNLTFLTIIILSLQAYGKPLKTERQYIPNQLIVKFKKSKSQPTQFLQKNFLKTFNANLITRFKSNEAILVEFPKKLTQNFDNNILGLIEKLTASPEIEYAEPNWILRLQNHLNTKNNFHSQNQLNLQNQNNLPNDPLFNYLHPYNSSNPEEANIFATEAWTKTQGSKNVLVAIVDSGVDYNHEDIAKNYWSNPGEVGLDSRGRDKKTNNIDDDQNGFVDDWRGWNFVSNNNDPMDQTDHGTHCAGTIGAVGNNSIGITGLNWNTSIVGLRFLDAEGRGSLSDGVLAIEYATQLGVDVMNNSWGGDEYSHTMAAAIQEANKAGILFVVAAGNNGSNNDINLDYPAAYGFDNVISVAAIDREGNLASFSNFGAKSVHIAAPGTQIYSTTIGNTYKYLDGTSMAAPFVSGAIALIKSKFPNLNAKQIKARILGTAQLTSKLQNNIQTGLLNISMALSNHLTPPSKPQKLNIVESHISALKIKFEQNSIDETIENSIAIAIANANANANATYINLNLNQNLNLQNSYNYEARYLKSKPIQTEEDWNNATPLKIETNISKNNINDNFVSLAQPSNFYNSTVKSAMVELKLLDLELNSSGYIALKAVDKLGNESELSQSIPYKLKTSKVIYKNDGNSLEGLTVEGTWDLENIPGHGSVLSDSPGTNYGYRKVNILNLPAVKVSSNDVVLSFDSKYDFESGYDFGTIEYSIDNGFSWKTLTTYSGSQDWTKIQFSFLKEETQFSNSDLKIRFKVESDSTTSLNGWLISNLKLISI